MPYYSLSALARVSREAEDTELVHPKDSEAIFREVYSSSKPRLMTLEASETLRTATLYRILRYMLRSLGQLARDESLSEKVREIYRSSGAPTLMAGSVDPTIQGSLAIKRSLETIPRPSLVPLSGAANELHALGRAYFEVGQQLKLDQAVVALFTHPDHCFDALPSAADVADYEMELLEATYEAIIASGITRARQQLQQEFGMGPREAYEITSTARFVMASAIEVDQETERKIQSDRLERLMDNAHQSLDTRMELASIKERNRLLGLTDRPPKDTTKEIMDVIAHVSEEIPEPYAPDFDDDEA